MMTARTLITDTAVLAGVPAGADALAIAITSLTTSAGKGTRKPTPSVEVPLGNDTVTKPDSTRVDSRITETVMPADGPAPTDGASAAALDWAGVAGVSLGAMGVGVASALGVTLCPVGVAGVASGPVLTGCSSFFSLDPSLSGFLPSSLGASDFGCASFTGSGAGVPDVAGVPLGPVGSFRATSVGVVGAVGVPLGPVGVGGIGGGGGAGNTVKDPSTKLKL